MYPRSELNPCGRSARIPGEVDLVGESDWRPRSHRGRAPPISAAGSADSWIVSIEGDRLGRAGWLVVHVPAAGVVVGAGPDPGMLESAGAGLRRYAAARHPVLSRLVPA